MACKVSIITPTPGRPTLALTKDWVQHQAYAGEYEWIIATSGDVPEEVEPWATVIKTDGKFRGKPADLYANTKAALAAATGDVVVVFEDDDYYAPDWISRCAMAIEGGAVLVGQQTSHHYFVPAQRMRSYRWKDRASWAATAFARTPEMVERVNEICRRGRGLSPDIDLWRLTQKALAKNELLDCNSVFQMKGVCPGLGMGHQPRRYYQCEPGSRDVAINICGAGVIESYEQLHTSLDAKPKPGLTAVVACSGPSLPQTLESLPDADWVIAVNAAIKGVPRADVWFAWDNPNEMLTACIDAAKEREVSFLCTHVRKGLDEWRELMAPTPVRWFKDVAQPEWATSLRRMRRSMCGAIWLAISEGATTIHLAGADLSGRVYCDKESSELDRTVGKSERWEQSRWPREQAWLMETISLASANGIKIIWHQPKEALCAETT